MTHKYPSWDFISPIPKELRSTKTFLNNPEVNEDVANGRSKITTMEKQKHFFSYDFNIFGLLYVGLVTERDISRDQCSSCFFDKNLI